MNLFDIAKVLAKRLPDVTGEQRDAILSSFAVPNDDVTCSEVNVLHAELRALEQAETRAVQQACHELWSSRQMAEHAPRLLTRENDGQ